MRTIALLTDFRLSDHFVGVMKGAILSLKTNVHLVDITHGVGAHDIRAAAFLLLSSFRYFPRNTIFVVVVDPGVGSKRKAIALKTTHYYFVGPDNGVLYPAVNRDRIKKIVALHKRKYFLDGVSRTFHGRDIFSPVAAHLARGATLISLGTPLKRMVSLTLPVPKITRSMLGGQIIYVDSFGNLVTNIPKEMFQRFTGGRQFTARIAGKKIRHLYTFYNEAPKSTPFFIEGSFPYLEISVKKQGAHRYFRCGQDAPVRISRDSR